MKRIKELFEQGGQDFPLKEAETIFFEYKEELERTGIKSYFSVKRYASEMNCAKPNFQFFKSLKRYCGGENYVYVGDDLHKRETES